MIGAKMDCRGATLALLLYCLTGGARGEEVVIRELQVPEFAMLGQDVELACRWSAPRGKLYSVKWYLNDREFFSYKPEENPSLVAYKLPGVTVNRKVSTGDRVILHNVQLTSSGKYKCEVIDEWPNFHTADKSAPMTVVEIPEDKPRISGTRPQYHIGDIARLTCSSARSLPPAQLTWYINDQEVPAEYLLPLNTSQHPDGLEETHLGLVFRVSGQHFVRGELHLRCSARISSLYYKTQQHSVEGRLTYSVPVMESRDISGMAGGVSSSGGGGGGGDSPPSLLVLVLVLVLEVLAPVLVEGNR
ncbi:uncharacterized protein [Panulirus ornatus]|uniref:uncharacterized protein isoform X2 n=1 Tax=Panulirus ornatus TaxID=150431 RepID=UPI003A8A5440